MECRAVARSLSLASSRQIKFTHGLDHCGALSFFFNSLPAHALAVLSSPQMALVIHLLEVGLGDGAAADGERISCNSCISSSIFQGELGRSTSEIILTRAPTVKSCPLPYGCSCRRTLDAAPFTTSFWVWPKLKTALTKFLLWHLGALIGL